MTEQPLGLIWPKTVPVLSASKILKWSELNGTDYVDKHTLYGWAIKTFEFYTRLEFFKVFKIAMQEVMRDTELEGINNFNDVDDLLEKKACAALWNRAAYLLGYTKDNPQSRKAVL